jgi:hypothetical protein
VKNFAEIALPLTNLIKEYNKSKCFTWSQACEDSFNKFKTIFSSAPMLHHFREDLQTRLYTDASNYAIGAVLCNFDPKTGLENPVQYLSKKLKPTQFSLTTSEKEYLALVYSLLKWRYLCYGRKIHVFTDHSCLLFYKNFKGISSRLTRLSLQIADYDLEMYHKSGKSMTLPDHLSRYPQDEEIIEDHIIDTDNLNSIIDIDLPALQLQDENLQIIINDINNPHLLPKNKRKLTENFKLQNNVLYRRHPGDNRRYVIALPAQLKSKILQDFHDDPMTGGHLFADKTYSKIKDTYYWKNMRKDIEQYVKTCDSCQRRKTLPLKPAGFLQPIPPTLLPLTRIQADIIGPIHASNGFHYILCVTCVSTRFAFAFPLRSAEADQVAKCLLYLINTFGLFTVLQTDRGRHFTANIIHHLHTALGSCHVYSSSYTPQVNGLVEGFNKTLINIISHYVAKQPNKWFHYLQSAVFAYNNTPHSCHGYKPSYLFLGYTPRTPSDSLITLPNIEKNLLENLKAIDKVRHTVPKLIREEQAKQKKYYDSRRRDLQLEPGDECLVYFPKDRRDNSSKFAYRYKGPYLITRKLTPVSYEIEILHNGKLMKDNIHVHRLKPYHRRRHELFCT